MTFVRPEKNNIWIRDRASTKSAKIVQISKPIAPRSERDATANATKGLTERQIANDSKRLDQTQAPNPAYLKASNAGDPRAGKGETTLTTRTLNAVLLTRAHVTQIWAKPQVRKSSPLAKATSREPNEHISPQRQQRAHQRPMKSDYVTSVLAQTISRTLAPRRSKTNRELGKPSRRTEISWPYGTRNFRLLRKSNAPTES